MRRLSSVCCRATHLKQKKPKSQIKIGADISFDLSIAHACGTLTLYRRNKKNKKPLVRLVRRIYGFTLHVEEKKSRRNLGQSCSEKAKAVAKHH